MALTLVEASKLTQDMMVRGVIETIVSESMVLNYLPFAEVVGNALTFNQENVLPAADFYAVGDTWTEGTPTFTQKTAKLAILGGDADVDNFLQQTYANPNDPTWAFGDQAGSHTNLAIARILGNDLDGARDALQPVVDLPVGQRINGIRHSVQRVQRAIIQGGLAASATDLVEEIDAFTAVPVAALPR